MANSAIPSKPDNTRSPGQCPAWCREDEPEDTGTDHEGGAVFSWSREFGTAHIGADLVAEENYTLDGGISLATKVYAYHPENRGMSLDEAEQLALSLIDAVKAAREGADQ